MSGLNPIQVDRYVLYLDSLVLIKINQENPIFYDLLFSDGTKERLSREFETDLVAQLPATFLVYDAMWINDNFIHLMQLTWDIPKQSFALVTKVKTFGEIREYHEESALIALMQLRTTISSGEINTSEEVQQIVSTTVDDTVQTTVQQAITTQVTPVVQQVVETTVQPIVQQSVTTEIQTQLNLQDYGDLFNSTLNQ